MNQRIDNERNYFRRKENIKNKIKYAKFNPKTESVKLINNIS